MKAYKTLWLLGWLTILSTASVHSQDVPFDSGRWEISARESKVEEYLGRNSLYLKGGVASVKDSVFTDGVIEFEIAFTGERGFMGAIWRMQDNQNYEEFYLRPHQSGNPDANQYTPIFNGLAGWQLYYGEGYGAPVVYAFNQWIPVRIVVSGGRAEMYINDMEKPALFAHELKREIKSGRVGLSASDNVPVHFSRFRFTATNRPPLKSKDRAVETAPPGTITSWIVSDAFDEKSLDVKYQLSQEDKKQRTWKTLACESTGLANLARVQGIGEKKNTVFARVTIISDRGQVKRIRFGFSDRVKAYFNDRLLYGGSDVYQSRDYRFLGTIGYFDELYLPLKKGQNELWLAVSEDFGGWGIKAMFDDLSGIRVR